MNEYFLIMNVLIIIVHWQNKECAVLKYVILENMRYDETIRQFVHTGIKKKKYIL